MKFWQIIYPIFPHSEKIRENWIEKQLAKLPKNAKLLDAGAGEAYYQRYCQHLQYISQDFCQYDGQGDKKGIQTGKRDFSKINIVSDITKIPVKSASFDAVLCVEVLEHLPQPLEALKELSRVLKKGGVLILTAPFASLTHYSPYYFYSGFSLNFYKKILPDYGFEIKETYPYGNYFDYLAMEVVRTPLVCWRLNKILTLPILLFYPLTVPFYLLLRFLSIILPCSQELLCFGHCLRVQKQ